MEEPKEKSVPFFNNVPTFWELPIELKRKLTKEFTIYVLKSIKFRHWVMFFSFWALAFQTNQLLDSYLEFDTVVKVEIVKPWTIDMPGVTICTDPYHMISRKKLMDRYPEIQKEFDDKGITKEEDMIVVLRKWKQLAYDNSTIHQWFSLMVDPDMVLDCKMIMRPEWHKAHNLTMPDCYNLSKILYTLPHGSGICWIFFSQVNPRDYRTKDWVVANDWYKIEVQLGILASFHIHFEAYETGFVYDEMPDSIDNPDKQPELAAIINYAKAVYPIISLDRATLKKGSNYELSFAQTNARMLNAPYHTDCRNYEEEGYWKQFKSNYHCTDGCLQEYMKKCNCMYNTSRGERITQWPADDSWASNLKFCEEVGGFSEKKEDVCRSSYAFLVHFSDTECVLKRNCKNHCYEEYYRYEVKQLYWDDEIDGKGLPENEDDEYFFARGDPEYKKARPTDNFATLRIKRRDVTDVTYEHTAEMIFVEFVCYFGGLLGLWLGVSILDVYHQSLIWYAEAPGVYRKWLEKQTLTDDVQRIRIEPDGKISVITGQLLYPARRLPPTTNFDADYGTSFGTSFGTQFSNNF